MLVRPDGYVSAVVTTADLGRIETYLDSVGIRPPSMITPQNTETSTDMPEPGLRSGRASASPAQAGKAKDTGSRARVGILDGIPVQVRPT